MAFDHDKGILNREKWGEYIPDKVKIQGDLGFLRTAKRETECRNSSQEAQGR